MVEIRNPDEVSVSLAVDVPPAASAAATRIGSIDEFNLRASEAVGAARAEATTDLAEWWRRELGGFLKFGKSSVSLWARYPGTSGVSVMTFYTDGQATGSVASIANTRHLMAADEVLARYEAAGFSGDPSWPVLDFDPTIEAPRLRVRELLMWAAGLISQAARP